MVGFDGPSVPSVGVADGEVPGPPGGARQTFDAHLLVCFGGPEGPDEVAPFVDNVLGGRPVPAAQLAEVAEHYLRFGGVSPINAQNRALLEAIRQELARGRTPMPVCWGNRNRHPYLADTVSKMAEDGVETAAAFVTSALRQLVEELTCPRGERLALGDLGAAPCPCAEGCCPGPQGRERDLGRAGSNQ